VAIGDLAELKVHGTSSGTVFTETRLGFRALTASLTWRQELADEFCSTVLPVWYSGLGLDVELREVRVSDVVPGTGLDVRGDTGGIVNGEVDSPLLPPQCAAVITWYSSLAGRSNRGRSYLAGLTQAYQLENRNLWNDDGQNYLNELGTVIMAQYSRTAGISSLGFLVVISKQMNGIPRGPLGVQVDDWTYRARMGTQRRRNQ
jgi:hypothetical protein